MLTLKFRLSQSLCIYVAVFFLFQICSTVCATMMAGAASEIKTADEKLQSIVDKVKPDFEKMAGGNAYNEFKAVSYRSQVVAGTNYFVKVEVGDNKYVHVRIFVPLPYTNEGPQAVKMQTDKTLDDEITYF